MKGLALQVDEPHQGLPEALVHRLRRLSRLLPRRSRRAPAGMDQAAGLHHLRAGGRADLRGLFLGGRDVQNEGGGDGRVPALDGGPFSLPSRVREEIQCCREFHGRDVTFCCVWSAEKLVSLG